MADVPTENEALTEKLNQAIANVEDLAVCPYANRERHTASMSERWPAVRVASNAPTNPPPTESDYEWRDGQWVRKSSWVWPVVRWVFVIGFVVGLVYLFSTWEAPRDDSPSIGGGAQVIQVSDPRAMAELQSLRASEDEWRCLDRERRARIERLLQEGD